MEERPPPGEEEIEREDFNMKERSDLSCVTVCTNLLSISSNVCLIFEIFFH